MMAALLRFLARDPVEMPAAYFWQANISYRLHRACGYQPVYAAFRSLWPFGGKIRLNLSSAIDGKPDTSGPRG